MLVVEKRFFWDVYLSSQFIMKKNAKELLQFESLLKKRRTPIYISMFNWLFIRKHSHYMLSPNWTNAHHIKNVSIEIDTHVTVWKSRSYTQKTHIFILHSHALSKHVWNGRATNYFPPFQRDLIQATGSIILPWFVLFFVTNLTGTQKFRAWNFSKFQSLNNRHLALENSQCQNVRSTIPTHTHKFSNRQIYRNEIRWNTCREKE